MFGQINTAYLSFIMSEYFVLELKGSTVYTICHYSIREITKKEQAISMCPHRLVILINSGNS
jgi:hypothetical protein